MRLLELPHATACALGVGPGRMLSHLRRLQDGRLFPKGRGGSDSPDATSLHASMLVLAELADVPGPCVVDAVADYAMFRHGELHAASFIAGVLTGVAADFHQLEEEVDQLSVTLHSGNVPAIVVRVIEGEDAREFVFSRDNEPWRPELADGIVRSNTLSGRALVRLAHALRDAG